MTILRITDGVITTVAGTGAAGATGDGGPARTRRDVPGREDARSAGDRTAGRDRAGRQGRCRRPADRPAGRRPLFDRDQQRRRSRDRRPAPLVAEVVELAAQPGPEVQLPEAVHERAGGQRVVFGNEPLREAEAVLLDAGAAELALEGVAAAACAELPFELEAPRDPARRTGYEADGAKLFDFGLATLVRVAPRHPGEEGHTPTLDTPIASIDGRPATPELWAATVLAGRATTGATVDRSGVTGR